jgi:hypothetical protein
MGPFPSLHLAPFVFSSDRPSLFALCTVPCFPRLLWVTLSRDTGRDIHLHPTMEVARRTQDDWPRVRGARFITRSLALSAC